MGIYLDGNLVGSADAPNTAVVAGATDLYIGQTEGLNRTFDGCIGQVLIFRRALSAAEIASLYQNPYQIWDVGEDEMEWAKAAAAAGVMTPYYYRHLTGGAA